MKVDGKTQLMGLIGWPVSHSFSPAMHNAAARALGLNWIYLPLPVRPAEIDTAVLGLAALGFRGVNVTVPHKQAVMSHLSTLEPGAQAIGAVNTIVIEESSTQSDQRRRLTGYNTDWSGFLEDLDALGVSVQGRDCLVLGAGGSARAIAYALAQAGGQILLLARRRAQAEELAAAFKAIAPIQTGSLADLEAHSAALTKPIIINTTPLGMTPVEESTVWPKGIPFPLESFVYDLVYNPVETYFMRQAKESGCRASNGLGMLVRQGAMAFALWTGIKPDTQVMVEALPF